MSPSPSRIEPEMDCFDALKAVTEGQKIARKSWGNSDVVFLHGEQLHIRRDDGLHRLIVSEGDLIGTDWTIVREQ